MDDLGKGGQAVGGAGCIAAMAQVCKGTVSLVAEPPVHPDPIGFASRSGFVRSQDGDKRGQWRCCHIKEAPLVPGRSSLSMFSRSCAFLIGSFRVTLILWLVRLRNKEAGAG